MALSFAFIPLQFKHNQAFSNADWQMNGKRAIGRFQATRSRRLRTASCWRSHAMEWPEESAPHRKCRCANQYIPFTGDAANTQETKMPSKYFTRTSVLRVCSSCAATVERKDCHKNRYSQYICRRCQEAGVKFIRSKRQRSSGKRGVLLAWTVSVFFLGAAIASLIVPALWNGTASESSSSAAKKPDAPIDVQGSLLLNTESRARLIESLDRQISPPRPDKPQRNPGR